MNVSSVTPSVYPWSLDRCFVSSWYQNSSSALGEELQDEKLLSQSALEKPPGQRLKEIFSLFIWCLPSLLAVTDLWRAEALMEMNFLVSSVLSLVSETWSGTGSSSGQRTDDICLFHSLKPWWESEINKRNQQKISQITCGPDPHGFCLSSIFSTETCGTSDLLLQTVEAVHVHNLT